ncbi:MAG: universal stress protein [Caldilinea sp. CFX5]|nr:universal stress protein [Caldilinea sp. CFX5]
MIGLYHKILVPLDGSTLAEQVLPHLPRLATPTDTTFVLVTVINTANYVATHSRYLPPDYFTRLRASAEEYLAEQRRPLEQAGFRVEAHVADGDAAGRILQVAATTQADLIAMTTHGRAGFVRWALGSVAERIVSETALPVFLVRETTALPTDKLHRILVPLDGSALAEQALPTAAALAKATGAELLLLQVMQPLDDRNQEILFKDAAEAQAAFAEWRTNAEAYLHQQAQPFQAEGVTCLYKALLGDVAPTIIDSAETEHIDLLVMSTHGRSGLRRWVYGSVANKVLRGVTCPLLLIHHTALGQSA